MNACKCLGWWLAQSAFPIVSYLLPHTRPMSQADIDRKSGHCLCPDAPSSLAPLIRWSDLRCSMGYILRVNTISKPTFSNAKTSNNITIWRGEV